MYLFSNALDKNSLGDVFMNVKMFQMGCGESILMHDDNEYLLIDFGSHPNKKSLTAYFNNTLTYLQSNYYKLNGSAMISHFHEDHINGFLYLINNSTIKFQTVYIPHIFTTEEHINLIDYMLMDYYLKNRMVPKSNGSMSFLSLLKSMINTQKGYTLLKRTDTFKLCDSINEVLWPIPQELLDDDFIIGDPAVNDIPLPVYVVKRIFEISERICNLVIQNNGRELSQYFTREITEFEEEINNIDDFLFGDNNEYIQLCNGTYISKDDYKNNFFNYKIVSKYINYLNKKLKVKDNETSIVFQTNNTNYKDYLFTGDITYSHINKIIMNIDGTLQLKNNFFAVKAPHHGTKSHYSLDLLNHTNPQIVFISNGEGGHAGPICSEYSNSTKFRLICTNDQSSTKKCNGGPCIGAFCPIKVCIPSLDYFDII